MNERLLSKPRQQFLNGRNFGNWRRLIQLAQISMKFRLCKWQVIFKTDSLHRQVNMIGLNMLACFRKRLHRQPEIGDGVEYVDGYVESLTRPKRL